MQLHLEPRYAPGFEPLIREFRTPVIIDHLGRPFQGTPREHAVLETLIRGVNKTISKKSLAESVFGFDDASSPENIEIYIHRVRKKLEPGDARIITLRGLGYLLKDRNSP